MKKKISKKRAIITAYLGHKSYEVKDSGTEEDTEYYKAAFSSEEERLAADAQAARTAAEGYVLLKNEDQALPLSGDNKVTLFEVSSAEILYGGAGQAQWIYPWCLRSKKPWRKQGLQ